MSRCPRCKNLAVATFRTARYKTLNVCSRCGFRYTLDTALAILAEREPMSDEETTMRLRLFQ